MRPRMTAERNGVGILDVQLINIRVLLLGVIVSFLGLSHSVGQTTKPVRSKPPEFTDGQLEDVFFRNPKELLKGKLPSKQSVVVASAGAKADVVQGTTENRSNDQDPFAWHNLASPETVEDLIKESKQRLDKLVTTPAAFASGGFVEARQEFSLLALLFAMVEVYPGDEIRFKKSAAMAREKFARAADNSKVGSRQSYNEAKQRLLDLGDLLNGSNLDGSPQSELVLGQLMDRVPLMRWLEWSHRERVAKMVASEREFKANADNLKRYAELVAVLGKLALDEDMPDATDDDYIGFSTEMMKNARDIVQAIETDNAEAARKAAAQIGQCCQDCHDNFS